MHLENTISPAYCMVSYTIFFWYWCFKLSVPTIGNGNLTVKSPQIEYLIRLLSLKFKVAT
jgi:hypothetical protein